MSVRNRIEASQPDIWQSNERPEYHMGMLHHTSPPVGSGVSQSITFIPSLYDYTGITIEHNMPCCVRMGNESAVYDMSTGVFQPSWKAQRDGWHIVKADTKFKLWVLKTLGMIK